MDKLRLSRQAYNLAERLINVLEKIAVELERYNDLQEENHTNDSE